MTSLPAIVSPMRPAVDDFDADGWAQSRKLPPHHLGIGRVRSQDPQAGRGGRADCDDPQRIARFEPRCGARQECAQGEAAICREASLGIGWARSRLRRRAPRGRRPVRAMHARQHVLDRGCLTFMAKPELRCLSAPNK
jgi:hypothetical protein